jgi:LemA protein
MEFLIGAVVVIVLALGFVGVQYNGLVRLRNEVKNAWAQIDVQLKRRHDLIPNLVETVKGYATHERETFERIAQLRSAAIQADGVENQGQAETALSGALGQLRVVVENYPDLKANQNFLALQEELTSTENKIGRARQFYNDSVMRKNTKVQSFPSNLIAGMFGFKEDPYFEVEDSSQRAAPQVDM